MTVLGATDPASTVAAVVPVEYGMQAPAISSAKTARRDREDGHRAAAEEGWAARRRGPYARGNPTARRVSPPPAPRGSSAPPSRSAAARRPASPAPTRRWPPAPTRAALATRP